MEFPVRQAEGQEKEANTKTTGNQRHIKAQAPRRQTLSISLPTASPTLRTDLTRLGKWQDPDFYTEPSSPSKAI